MLCCKGGSTPTASRQASRHETKDAVLLHSWFRLEFAHRSSNCLRLVTSSLVDDMTSCWVLMSQSWRTEKEHAESCCTCLQHKADVSIRLRPVCGGFHNLIRFNCAPFFASCRRHRVLTVTCLDACRCSAYLRFEVLTAAIVKSYIIWDKNLRPWTWRWHVALIRHLTFKGLLGVISQNMELFMCCVDDCKTHFIRDGFTPMDKSTSQ
jgi:hypothetical protein